MAARVEEAKLVTIAGERFLVDGFQFQRLEIQHYVLTHFHSDHTIGLTRNFATGTIYCSPVTAALVTEILGVDAKRVRSLQLREPLEIGRARFTLLDADHCPGSVVVAFEDLDSERVVVHTGDCRASPSMRNGLLEWLASRKVDELFLDTTYCAKRWCFPPQDVACRWLQEITRSELAREPRTLFVVGAYQIGKERALRAVAKVVDTPAFVEHKRWQVLQLAGWGEAALPSGKPLWSIDKEGCHVWMTALGGLGHDALKHFLDSTKGKFSAVVAFRATGWAWAPRAMAAHGSAACRAWVENEGQTRIYGVPYSEHSSYDELQALGEALRPRRLLPTVNSETRAGKEKMMSHFLNVVDLQADPERMDHYLPREGQRAAGSNVAFQDLVDVLALSARPQGIAFVEGCDAPSAGDAVHPAVGSPPPPAAALSHPSSSGQPAEGDGPREVRLWSDGRLKKAQQGGERRLWRRDALRGVAQRTPTTFGDPDCKALPNCNEPSDLDAEVVPVAIAWTAAAERRAAEEQDRGLVEIVDSGDESFIAVATSPKLKLSSTCELPGGDVHSEVRCDPRVCGVPSEECRGEGGEEDELRRVDLLQQQRLLRFFEAARRPPATPQGPRKLRPAIGATGRARGRGRAAAGRVTGAACANTKVLKMLGASVRETQVASKTRKGKLRTQRGDASIPAAKRRSRSAAERAAKRLPRGKRSALESDGKTPTEERRATRFVPRPSARIRERIDRALVHRLYFLAWEPVDSGVQLDILGSTGNVYHVKLAQEGNACSCIDFGKGAGVCKHLLFVTLRVLRLDRDDHRVWQTSFTPSELTDLLGRLDGGTIPANVQADPTVLRGYQQALGQREEVVRRSLPADCPICFEEMPSPPASASEASCGAPVSTQGAEVTFCHCCGHNVHVDCQRRWAEASRGGNACPMCRSPWVQPRESADGPINLAGHSTEHRGRTLRELYPDTHQWIARRDRLV